MNQEQKAKQRFVDRHLSRLVQAATGNEAKAVDYFEQGGEEFCRIRYRNGFDRRVCVTGDSLKALARDVIDAM